MSIRSFSKYGLLIALAFTCAFPIYGVIFPWDAGEQALLKFKDQIHIPIGYSYQSETFKPGDTTIRSRTYILIPAAFSDFQSIVVGQVGYEATTVKLQKNGFTYYITSLLLTLIAVWWLWRKPVQKEKPNQ